MIEIEKTHEQNKELFGCDGCGCGPSSYTVEFSGFQDYVCCVGRISLCNICFEELKEKTNKKVTK